MQPLANSAVANSNQAGATPANQGNSGVVLRWRTSARVTSSPSADNGFNGSTPTGYANSQAVGNATSNGMSNSIANSVASPSLAARTFEANATRPSTGSTFGSSTGSSTSVQSASYAAQVAAGSIDAGAASNPLRSSLPASNARSSGNTVSNSFVPRGAHNAQRSAVQPANFQAPAGNAPPAQGGNGLSDRAVAPPNFPAPSNSPAIQPPTLQPPANFPPTAPQDALTLPEDAPAPPVAPPAQEAFPKTPDLGAPPAQDSNPAAPMPNTDSDLGVPGNQLRNDLEPPKDDDSTNPFKNRGKEELESPSDRESARRSRELEKKRSEPDASANCEAFRDKLRNSSIQKIDLNAAPRYGQGLNDNPEKAEKQRLDFAASSEVRDWCDRHGRTILQGRMIDLVNEQVVLDINGARREVPLRDLCDVDLAYVGKVWHLPVTCGSGYEEVPGRSFAPSAIQWKASGLCHKPLYFEEVQLERYGHEVGPVLQPLISTAHFFGNIAVLPYKMGIHPPHECQYSLGYYRPGDCAPYMLPPVPISLRGAAVQAGAVVGGAALVP